jgi:NTE family protein
MAEQERRLDGVFEGGGVKGIGLVGALSVIEAQGYHFVNLAGTSAGAVVAALLAAGYQAGEIRQILLDLDFTRLLDTSLLGRIPFLGPLLNVVFHLGLYRGDYFLKQMRELLAAKGVRTFRDLILAEFADDVRYRFKVRVVASDLTRGRMIVLPQDAAAYGLVPEDMEVALAVRMSMSIPFFFRPVKLKGSSGPTSYVVDGGLLSNFPVELFDLPGLPPWPTFGFRLVDPAPPELERHPIGGPVSLMLAMVGTALEAHDARYIETHNFVRTITIDTLNVAVTDFDLTQVQKEALYDSGIAGAKHFLETWDFEKYKALYRSGGQGPTRRELVL